MQKRPSFESEEKEEGFNSSKLDALALCPSKFDLDSSRTGMLMLLVQIRGAVGGKINSNLVFSNVLLF